MASTNLAHVIDTVLSRLAHSHPEWWDTAHLWAVIDPEYIEPVSAVLKADPITRGLEGMHITDGLGFGGALDLNRLAQWMIYRSREAGATETIYDVREFVSSNAPEMLTVHTLSGVRLENHVQLEPDLFLMPTTELPPCQQRNEALGLIPCVSLQMQPLRPWPTTALVMKYMMSPAVSQTDRPSKQAPTIEPSVRLDWLRRGCVWP